MANVNLSSRWIKVKLSDEDVKALCEKAGSVGLTVGELLEHFIGDLICGTHTNGSDERMYAEQWFNRCFGYLYDTGFLSYLIGINSLDDLLDAWDRLQDANDDLSDYTEHPEDAAPGEISDIQGDIIYWQQVLDDFWKEYSSQRVGYHAKTFDEEMQEVLKWRVHYQLLLDRGHLIFQNNDLDRSNDTPLTLAALREMDGDPVIVVYDEAKLTTDIGYAPLTNLALVDVNTAGTGIALVDKMGGFSNYATDDELQAAGLSVYPLTRKGKWILKDGNTAVCSRCHRLSHYPERYCPFCAADLQ